MEKIKVSVKGANTILPINGKQIRCPFDVIISNKKELLKLKTLLRSYNLKYNINPIKIVPKKEKPKIKKGLTKIKKVYKKTANTTLEKLIE